ncbi:hypothetical protein [Amycolatopsis albispora]|uniref:hypothetical protein n=1 Tax=Amycolatopsis albispora TaxID=1804986 RepID=UPI001F27DF25|nr:hypothetical protein [Amycolatopsis albispora]
MPPIPMRQRAPHCPQDEGAALDGAPGADDVAARYPHTATRLAHGLARPTDGDWRTEFGLGAGGLRAGATAACELCLAWLAYVRGFIAEVGWRGGRTARRGWAWAAQPGGGPVPRERSGVSR